MLYTNDLDGFDKVSTEVSLFNTMTRTRRHYLLFLKHSKRYLFCFLQRKLPSPGFQVEVVLVDTSPNMDNTTKKSDESSGSRPSAADGSEVSENQNRKSGTNDRDDVFSDSESEGGSSKSKKEATSGSGNDGSAVKPASKSQTSTTSSDDVASLTHATKQVSLGDGGAKQTAPPSDRKGDGAGRSDSLPEVPNSESEFKAMAADASVFTFGDDEDYESE